MRTEPKCAGNAEDKSKETSKGHSAKRVEERDFGWNKVKVSGCIYCDLMWTLWKEEKKGKKKK